MNLLGPSLQVLLTSCFSNYLTLFRNRALDSCEIAELLGSQAATAIQNGRLYRQLNEYNRSLEEEVKERTLELSTGFFF